MADFEIERPSVELNQVNPTFNVNPPQFTIEIHGSVQGQRGEKGEKGDTGEPGRDGIDGINGIDGIDGEDGVGVESIIQTSTSHESGGTNIITATLTDGTETTVTITKDTTENFTIKSGQNIVLDLNGKIICLDKGLFWQLGSCTERVNDDENVWGFKVKTLNLRFYSFYIKILY